MARKTRTSQKNGRRSDGNGRNGRRNGNRRRSENGFVPEKPDEQEFVPYGDEFLSVGRWDDSGQWNYLGRSDDDEDSEIFRSYDPDGIPDHVPALIVAAGLYLNGDTKLPKKTKEKLEAFVSAMTEAGYAEAA